MKAVVLALAVAASLVAGPLAAQPGSADERAIRARVADWNRMIAARDLNGVVGLYAPDASFMASGAPLATGPALREAWKGLLGLPDLKATLTPLEVRVAASGDLAMERGAYSLGAGGAPPEVGKYVVVWKKVGGQWKVAADIFNSDAPAR